MTRCQILSLAFLICVLVFWILPAWAGTLADDVWVRTYNGPGNSHDQACAVAVDDLGNVYVTGQSEGDGTDWDYATIKYFPNGDTAWVRRYNGPANGPDLARAMAIDGSGNVYVTGYSRGIENNADYLTIKYHTNGDTAWVRRYNGPAGSTDVATSIAVDFAGNVYVAGSSMGVGTEDDYATIKYNPDGDQVWVVRYNGPANTGDDAYAVVVDNAGNIYVSGESDGITTGSDFATIKYDSEGNELWVKRCDGIVTSGDIAHKLALDGLANVYVTGFSYDSEIHAIYATVKYDSSGTEIWSRTYQGEMTIGPGGVAVDIAADNSGNAWVTGWTRNSGTNYDYTTVKYDAEGNQLWAARYHSWADGCEGAEAIAVDGNGNAYVTGWSEDVNFNADDCATVKYDPEGNQEWVARYNGSGNYQDAGLAIAVDDSNNVYVTGEAAGTTSAYDYVTIKYVQIEGTRGDANGDDEITISDAVFLINYLFKNGSAPDPIQAGDANNDDDITIVDVVYLVNYLFKNGPKPF
ncbi:MAG: SBBP repeat-containing protein [Candidatus Zixiibacteriota bacterium]